MGTDSEGEKRDMKPSVVALTTPGRASPDKKRSTGDPPRSCSLNLKVYIRAPSGVRSELELSNTRAVTAHEIQI